MDAKEIEFIRWLSAYDRLRQKLTAEKGQVIRFVVQYEAYIERTWRAIVRYDAAHGYFHKDVIHPDGSTRKTRLPAVGFAEALTQAELDMKDELEEILPSLLGGEEERSDPEEGDQGAEEFFLKNLTLTTELDKYLVAHPEVAEQIPQHGVLVLLPEDDPPFCRNVMGLIQHHPKDR